jgi:hypothetical protein
MFMSNPLGPSFATLRERLCNSMAGSRRNARTIYNLTFRSTYRMPFRILLHAMCHRVAESLRFTLVCNMYIVPVKNMVKWPVEVWVSGFDKLQLSYTSMFDTLG